MVYKNATLLTPNLPEAKMLIGKNLSDKVEIGLLLELRKLYKVKYPLITLGKEE